MYSHGKDILRGREAKQTIWGRSAVLVLIAFVLLMGIVVITGTADFHNCVQFNLCN